MNNIQRSLMVTVIAGGCAGVIHASDAVGPGDSDSRWILGAGAASYNNIYRGEGSEAVVFPNIIYNGERFFVKDGAFNLSLLQGDAFSGGLIVKLQGNFLTDDSDYDDNHLLAGLEERETNIDGGFFINHSTEMGRFNATVLTDASSEHGGHSLAMSYTFDLTAGNWAINPVIGLQWISDKKVDHLYGVSASEATTFRTAYEADSAVNVFAGVRGRYQLNQHWDANLSAGVTSLSSSIKDSSIIEDDLAYHVGASINYNF
jgi:outer membrane protein